MKKLTNRQLLFIGLILTTMLLGTLLLVAVAQSEVFVYLPVVAKPDPTPTPTPTPTATPSPTPQPTMIEARALWVTRFDWTGSPNPAKIDEIVNNTALAGFNMIFFQVRGEADAFYASNVEPWSRLLTGTLGRNPGWDPLAYMVQQAHAKGIQVHAYINVYPVWAGCLAPPDGTTPRHLYYLLRDYHGTTNGKLNGLQWNSSGQVVCSSYQRATPASVYFDNHFIAVVTDLVTRYGIDGIHLDHIRYDSSNTSYDPVSQANYDNRYTYADWQRRQVNGTVSKIYDLLFDAQTGIADKNDFWLTAAVWPNYSSGYSNYYQDPKAWLLGVNDLDPDNKPYIDSVSPMIYGGFDTGLSSWQSFAQDYQYSRNGRYIIPGIGGSLSSFAEIEARINAARQMGTAGHAIFSYSSLLANNYFQALANGPYATPAVVPNITWHP